MIPAFYGFARFTVWLALSLLWRFRAVGVRGVPLEGPLIVACNHVSYFDPPALGVAMPRPVTYMAKEELFRIPLLGPVIRWLGAFPVDRKRGDVAAIKAAIRILETGAALGIFPEGTRSPDGRLHRGKTGVARMALASGAPVVPVGITGTDRALPRGSKLPRPHPVHIAFGPPITSVVPENEAKDPARIRALTDQVMAAIRALSGQETAAEINPAA